MAGRHPRRAIKVKASIAVLSGEYFSGYGIRGEVIDAMAIRAIGGNDGKQRWKVSG